LLELFDFYTGQMAACVAQIQQHYTAMKPRWDMPFDQPSSLPPPRPRKKGKNSSALDVEAEIIRVTGVDLAAIGDIGSVIAQTVLSEIDTDTSKWLTDKHFGSWLGLLLTMTFPGAKCRARERCLPTIAPVKPFAKRPQPSGIVQPPWLPFIVANALRVPHCLPKSPPITK
jgi:hypothetical protein